MSALAVSVAAIVLHEGRVLVARRLFSGPLGGLWEFPGGKVEAGETEEAALMREFLEEFGVTVRPLRRLGQVSFLHKGHDRDLVAWLAQLPEDAKLVLHEHLSCDWVALDRLGDLDLADSDRKLLPLIASLR